MSFSIDIIIPVYNAADDVRRCELAVAVHDNVVGVPVVAADLDLGAGGQSSAPAAATIAGSR